MWQVRIPVNDLPHAQLSPYFDKVADLIEKRSQKGERCLVHCVAGVSRSASLCIAYLMKYHRYVHVYIINKFMLCVLHGECDFGSNSLRGPHEVIDWFLFFILLSWESGGGGTYIYCGTNPDLLRSCLCFQVIWFNFASDFFNLLLVRFHQAERIMIKHLIQERDNKTWVRLELPTLWSWLSWKQCSEPLRHAAN